MTINEFFDKAELLWPGKPLTLAQRGMYAGKLLRFNDAEISRIFENLSEHSKFLPKVADIYDAARECGLLDKQREQKPHQWDPSDCRMCGGSGQVAVFYEQVFDRENNCRTLTLKRVMQYESSQPLSRQTDWTRYLFTCSCKAGDAPTLPKIRKWDPNKSPVLRLAI